MNENDVQLLKNALINMPEQIMDDHPISIVDSVPPPKGDFDSVLLRDVIFKTRERIQHNYAAIVESHVEDVFNDMGIEGNHFLINKLETAASNNNKTAWRPTTGELPIPSIIISCYENYKKELEHKLAKQKKATSEIEQEVIRARAHFSKGMQEGTNAILYLNLLGCQQFLTKN